MSEIRHARPFVVGANHRSSSVLLRDRMFVDETRVPVVFERLSRVGIHQAILLSTCDRVEVQGAHEEPLDTMQEILNIFSSVIGGSTSELNDQLYFFHDDEAVRHIFSVVSSLDSQVIGESQVLAQVKESHRLGRDYGMVSSELEGIFQSAYSVSKRIRSETRIGEGPVSLATSALQIVRNVHGDLGSCTALILGLGDMGEFIGGHLRAAGLGRTMLAGPSRRTRALARRMGWHYFSMEKLADALAEADIVVTAAGTGVYLITAEQVAAALKRRRYRPILLLDGAVPGDIEPATDLLEGAFVYTLDDLERVALASRTLRENAASQAWKIVDEEVALWRQRQVEQTVVPVLIALRRHFEETRGEILISNPQANISEVTRLLINRLLHHPSCAIRELASTTQSIGVDGGSTHEALVRRLFKLPLGDD